MSDDLDFDMEVVEKDKLDEPRGNTEAGSYEAASSKSSSVERKSTDSGISKSSGGESAEEARVAGNGGGSTASPSLADSPDAWRQIKLGDLLSYEVSGTWGDDPDDGGGKPVLRATNFAPNSIDLGDVALRKISDSHRESKRLKEGDIVLERSGGSADQPVGRVLFFDLEGEYYPGNFLRLMRPDPEVVNRRYLYYYLDYRYKRGDTIPVQTNSTNIRNLQYTSYLNLDTQLPPLPEQRKIASVLYAVDQAIQKTEAIIEQAKRVKRGLMQDMMRNGLQKHDLEETETRFGTLPRSWEVKRLKELGKIAGRTAPEKEDSECWGGDIPWATPSEITSLEGNTITKTNEYLTERALEKVSSNLLPPGSVLLTTRATVGACAVNTVPMTTNQGFKNVIPGDDLDTWYAYYRMVHEADQLEARAKGSTFREVGKETVENFEIPVPPREEQQRIGEILKSIDDAILNNKETVSEYERLKKGLLQDLLTGEVRTAGKAIDLLDEVVSHG